MQNFHLMPLRCFFIAYRVSFSRLSLLIRSDGKRAGSFILGRRVETDLCNPTDIFDPTKSASVSDKQGQSIAKGWLREYAILHLERAHGCPIEARVITRFGCHLINKRYMIRAFNVDCALCCWSILYFLRLRDGWSFKNKLITLIDSRYNYKLDIFNNLYRSCR